MSKPFIQIMGVDENKVVRRTGLVLTQPPVKQTFNKLKKFAVEPEKREFIITFHNAEGVGTDSINISAETFERITGGKPPTSKEMVENDEKYFAELEKRMGSR